ncbi:MAG: hypothetical protein ACYS8Z_13420 [Planctomycetota bacterium]|jgi:hypothetical protein
MWKRPISIKYAIVGGLLITLIVLKGCGSAPDANAWRTSKITDNGTVDGLPQGSVLVADPKQVGDNVRIHMVDTLCNEAECRIIAIDTDGQTHVGERTVRFGRDANYRSTIAVFADTNLQDIKEFQFQARPCREEKGKIAAESRLSDAVRKRRLVDEVYDNNLFVSNSVD